MAASLPIDPLQNFIAALPQQRVRYGISQCYGITSLSPFAKYYSAIGIGHNRVQSQFSIQQLGGCSNRDLAAASHAIEQCPLAGSCQPGRRSSSTFICSSIFASSEFAARTSMASAPWPAAGHITSMGMTCRTRLVFWRRLSPAAARMIAS